MKRSASIFTNIFFTLTFLWTLQSCGLKYTPQVTSAEREERRKMIIEQEIKKEFATKGLKYKSVGYGQSAVIKPASYQKLDSLFAAKYNLEQQGRKDRRLDEQIEIQRLICQNDTNEVLYMEQHVFTLENDSTAEVLAGNFALNKQNEIKKVEFTESYQIPKDLIKYYSYYIFEQSFMGSGQPSQAETSFYKMYKTELQNKTGAEKDVFLSQTLRIMQVANKIKSLEKQPVLEELTRVAVHKGDKNYKNEFFLKIEQSVLNDGSIEFYNIDYQSENMVNGKSVVEKYTLYFDPFFSLTSIQKVDRL